MIFHENRLLADHSHEILYLIFFKLGKMSQNLSSAAVVIDKCADKIVQPGLHTFLYTSNSDFLVTRHIYL